MRRPCLAAAFPHCTDPRHLTSEIPHSICAYATDISVVSHGIYHGYRPPPPGNVQPPLFLYWFLPYGPHFGCYIRFGEGWRLFLHRFTFVLAPSFICRLDKCGTSATAIGGPPHSLEATQLQLLPVRHMQRPSVLVSPSTMRQARNESQRGFAVPKEWLGSRDFSIDES